MCFQRGDDLVAFIIALSDVECIETVTSFNRITRQPLNGPQLPIGPDRDDGLDPRGVEEGVPKVVTVKLQDPTQRTTKLGRGRVFRDVIIVRPDGFCTAPADEFLGVERLL